MAREFIDGFETGSMHLWDYASVGWQIREALNMAGGSYCAWSDDGSLAYKNLTSRTEYYGAMKFKRQWTNGTEPVLLKFANNSTILATITASLSDPGLIKIYRGDSTNLIATGSIPTPITTSFILEWNYKPATDATGKFILKINGAIDPNLNLTNIQTSNNALNINRVYIGFRNSSSWDDFVIDSSEWVGTTKIAALTPVSDGNSTQFTPSVSGSSHYSLVDEIGPSDTDYVYTNSADVIDTYAISNLPSDASIIKSVVACLRGKYDGVPTPTKIAPVFRINGTDYAGSDIPMTSVSATYYQIYSTSPATSNPFTVNEVNSLESGIKARV